MVKIGYIGLEPRTLSILCSDLGNKIIFVSKIDFPISYNIFNIIINFLYTKNLKVPNVLLEMIYFFLTYPYKKYVNYFNLIFTNNIKVVDIESGILPNTDISIINCWSILAEKQTSHADRGIINIHPSKLPKYKGSLPTLWSLKHRDTSSAVSFIIIDSGVDSGNLLKQIDFDIYPEDNSITLEDKIMSIVGRELNPLIQNYLINNLKAYAQKSEEESFTLSYSKHKKIEFHTEDFTDILNKVLLYPYIEPGCFCFFIFKGKKIYIKNIFFYKDKKVSDIFKISLMIKNFIPTVRFHRGGESLFSRLFIDVNMLDSFIIIFNIQLRND